jgi:hypothetical protein
MLLTFIMHAGFIRAADLPGAPDLPAETGAAASTAMAPAPTVATTMEATKPPAAQEPIPSAPTPEPVKVSVPAPAEKETLPMPAPKEGLDTIDIEEGGNWLLKRKALEDTADTIEKIVNDFSKILEASTTFKIKRNKLDNDYDLYIATVGFNLGDLDQILTNLMEELAKEEKKEGELSADERAVAATIKEKKNDIKQLQEDLKALAALDEEIDKVVDTVDSQIKTANNYQNQAWKNFQQIKKVLSDEKAEELYYRTVSLQKSMQEIYTYLTTTLSSYFATQIDTMRSKMGAIKNQIGTLQTKGIDLQKEIEKLEEEDQKQDKERLQEEHEEALKKAAQETQTKLQESSWWHSIKNAIYWPFVQVANLWNYTVNSILSLFKGKPVEKLQPEKSPEALIESSEAEAKQKEAAAQEEQ